jgi:hypothetical protein
MPPKDPSAYKALRVEDRVENQKRLAEWRLGVKEGHETRHFKSSVADGDTNVRRSETGRSEDKGDWNIREFLNDGDKEVEKKEYAAPFGDRTPKQIFKGFDVNVDKFGGATMCVACGALCSPGDACVCGHQQPVADGGRPKRSSKKGRTPPRRPKKKTSKKKSKKSKGKAKPKRGR